MPTLFHIVFVFFFFTWNEFITKSNQIIKADRTIVYILLIKKVFR